MATEYALKIDLPVGDRRNFFIYLLYPTFYYELNLRTISPMLYTIESF